MNNEQEMTKIMQDQKIDLPNEKLLIEKERLKTEMYKVLKDFLKLEGGNRVTLFNIEGLSSVLTAVLDSNTFYDQSNDQSDDLGIF